MQEIAPLNVLSAMFVLQIILGLTMLLGVALDRSKFNASKHPNIYIFLFVSFIVCSLGIVFIQDFYTVWQPMFGDLHIPTLSTKLGIKVVYGVNYLTVFCLIAVTGRRHSPLMPILFLLPTTSIFLRESSITTLSYGFISAAYYLLLSFQPGGQALRFMSVSEPLLPLMSRDKSDSYTAHRIVTLLCLAITLLIGYITSPNL